MGWFLYLTGATAFAFWWHRREVVILNYHGISENGGELQSDPLDLNVSLENFRSQLEYLRVRHNVISLREFLSARLEGKPLPDYSVVLTFDDGYRDFLNVAPLLAKERLPATLFLVTDLIRESSNGSDSNHANRLSWAEVKALDDQGIFDFGSHTCSHPSLTSLTAETLDYELRASLKAIQSRVKNVAPALAYPNGAYSNIPVSAVASIGYKCGLTIDPGSNSSGTNAYALRRQTIHGSDDKRMFAARLSCVTSWLYGSRAAALGLFSSIFSFSNSGSPAAINEDATSRK
ncbi:MAG TPA: polysaccharide deacetylase family protein [Pyrinomonadaceae bacterium]|jgi:peptidoglycan/xylan/chitin deacetylase (PgdA/CDA1 family)